MAPGIAKVCLTLLTRSADRGSNAGTPWYRICVFVKAETSFGAEDPDIEGVPLIVGAHPSVELRRAAARDLATTVLLAIDPSAGKVACTAPRSAGRLVIIACLFGLKTT